MFTSRLTLMINIFSFNYAFFLSRLNRATQVDPKHAPAWQAWGVLETRHGTPSVARDIFQQGIWAYAQSGGQMIKK